MQLYEFAQSTLEEACKALVPPSRKQECPGTTDTNDQLCRAAVIGFAGSVVRGTLGIATSEEGLRRIHDSFGTEVPGGAEPGPDGQYQREDALAELANLLIGHVKRAWLRRDVSITIATPLVMRGLSIEVCGAKDSGWCTSESSHGDDRVTAWIDLHGDLTLDVSKEVESPELVSEGETLLF